MIVFFYDKTFEGLLSSVFDAFDLKIFPDKLLKEGEVAPLFVLHTYTVFTQGEKSNRVWKGLEKRLSKIACNMIIYAWQSEQQGSDDLIFKYICRVFQDNSFEEMNFADPIVLELQQIAKKVSKERHYLMQFVRFRKTADGIFFAAVSPAFNALPLSLSYFTDRFADQKWVIYDIKRRFGYYYDLKTVEEITFDNDEHLLSGKLDESLMAEDEMLFQKLWKEYLKSLAIKERMNLRLQRQHMPARFWKLMTEKQ